MNSLTVGGCKIPITKDIQQNLKELKEAIDWASLENVQLLGTPECSLSGYLWKPENSYKDPRILELNDALSEIKSYSKQKKVDLVLGTAGYSKMQCWSNLQLYIFNGNIINEYSKLLITPPENMYTSTKTSPPIIIYNGISISGVICNDFWSNPVFYGGASGQILGYLMNKQVQLVFVSAFVPKEPGLENSFYHWHLGQISAMSLYCQFATVVSDSSTNLDGSDYSGPPACPAGIWSMDGSSILGEKYFKKTFR